MSQRDKSSDKSSNKSSNKGRNASRNSGKNTGTGGTSRAQADRYGAPTVRRTALAPGLLAAIVMLAGFALIGQSSYIIVQYIVAIFALIVAWFAFQAKQWWWIPLLLAVAVIWNPVVPFGFDGPLWVGAQYVAILLFVLVAIFVKVPITDQQTPGRAR